MSALPFSDFLELLRGKDFGIGLHEHLALGKLLSRWDSTDRVQLRNAIAALVARHDEEVRQIRALFDETYPIATDADKIVDPVLVKTRRFNLVRVVRSGRLWAAGLVSIAVVTAAFLAIQIQLDPPLPLVPSATVFRTVAPVKSPNVLDGAVPRSVVESPQSPVVQPPDPPARLNWRSLGWLGAPTLALTFLMFWSAQLRTGARRWTIDAWEAAMAVLPGPFQTKLVMKDLVTRLPRADVEEAATVLGRAFSRDRPSRLLDVRETLRQSLRSGMQPHLVFRPRRVPKAVLVLQDVSQSMASHNLRVESLFHDLQRQGIALDRWFFDGDVSFASRRRFGVPLPLETLLRTREDGPVLILSVGFGVPATLARPNHEWLRALEKQTARVWVTPILDPKLWPAALQRLPIVVVPMTRSGLLQAARILAHDDRVSGSALGHALTAPRPVTPSHVEQLRQIASLVPYPTPDLLELLRQQFALDIPETAVLYAVDRRAAGTGLPFRMPDEEIRERLRNMRAQSPALETRVRKYLLKVLADSEPPAGSAAHLRWEASVAIHDVQLAELEGTDGAPAVDALQQLYRGPLWEEVRDLVARQASTGRATSQLRTAVKVRRTPDPPAFVDRTGGSASGSRMRWAAPGWRELAAALLVAAFVTGLAAFTSPFQRRSSNDPDAYQLDFVAGVYSSDAGSLQIRRRPVGATVPPIVTLYRDQAPIGAPIVLDATAASTVPLTDAGVAAYQVRATRPDGALALSNSIWAPSTVVVIDAQPWARVTVNSADGKIRFAQATPVAVRLPEGRYTLSLENGGLTPPLTQTIDVTAGGQRSFRYVMPGFKVDDVLKNLTPASSRKSAK